MIFDSRVFVDAFRGTLKLRSVNGPPHRREFQIFLLCAYACLILICNSTSAILLSRSLVQYRHLKDIYYKTNYSLLWLYILFHCSFPVIYLLIVIYVCCNDIQRTVMKSKTAVNIKIIRVMSLVQAVGRDWIGSCTATLRWDTIQPSLRRQ